MTTTEQKIVSYIQMNGPVTAEDIQNDLHIASLKSVHMHVKNIRKTGFSLKSNRMDKPHLGRKNGEYYWIVE